MSIVRREQWSLHTNVHLNCPSQSMILMCQSISRGQAVLGRQVQTATPWLTERHGYGIYVLGAFGGPIVEPSVKRT